MIARSDFHDPSLYDLACTHRSMDGVNNNQRLEFLGDRVLGLVLSDMLYKQFPNEREGDLAMRLAALANADSLYFIAQVLDLNQHIIVTDAEARNGGLTSHSNLADMAEALIGALYLDSGLQAAQDFIVRYWSPLLHKDITPPKDSKTMLQEWSQGQGLPLPEYVELGRFGPSHAPEFTIEVRVKGYKPHSATCTSKRSAQQQAAEALLRSEGVIPS